jgi:hypothetical protein
MLALLMVHSLLRITLIERLYGLAEYAGYFKKREAGIDRYTILFLGSKKALHYSYPDIFAVN